MIHRCEGVTRIWIQLRRGGINRRSTLPPPNITNFAVWISEVISQKDDEFTARVFELIWVPWKKKKCLIGFSLKKEMQQLNQLMGMMMKTLGTQEKR